MPAIAFEHHSRTLFFVPSFFDASDVSAFVSWRSGMAAGAAIRKGQVLAIVFWDDGTDDEITSPVAGTIVRTNRRIAHEKLHLRPPQWALILT